MQFKKQITKVLVTGATGFLGKRLVKILVETGYQVRAFVRENSDVDYINSLNVDLQFGDIADEKTLELAISGVDCIVHAAAAQEGDWEDFDLVTIQGTEKVLRLSKANSVKRLIYISSMSVYQMENLKAGSVVDENGQLESEPQRRGYYTLSKVKAEQLVLEFMDSDDKIETVILRPATIYGPGSPIFNPVMGISFFDKIFLILGRKNVRIPLVYIDNLIEAIILCIDNDNAVDEVFNVIDDDLLTKHEYIVKYIKQWFPCSLRLFLPYGLVMLGVFLQEKILETFQMRPILTQYRLNAASNFTSFSNRKIKESLNWRPRVTIDDGIKETLLFYSQRL